MVDLMYFLTNLSFFVVTLLHYHINLRSSIIFCLFSGDIDFFLGISLSNHVFSASRSSVHELFCGEVLKTFAVLSAILLPTTSPAASANF